MRDGSDCPAIDTYRQAFLADVVNGNTAARSADEAEDREESGERPNAPSDALRPGPNDDCTGAAVNFGNSSIYGGTFTP